MTALGGGASGILRHLPNRGCPAVDNGPMLQLANSGHRRRHRRPFGVRRSARAIGPRAGRAAAWGATSLGAAAVGALSTGAGAILALAIRNLAIRRGVIRDLDIRTLRLGRLEIDDLVVRHPSGVTPPGQY
jgi:hypothetical protein